MDRERTQAIVQLDAVFQCESVRLNDVFDTLAVHGMDLRDLLICSRRDLIERLYFSPDQADQFMGMAQLASRTVDRLELDRFSLLTRADEQWPSRVQCHPASGMMPWLFVAGDSSLLNAQSVGVGGSRDATLRSLEITRMLAEHVARRGATVVSGGARGIDDAAHRAALEVDGRTVVVLAQGIATFQVPPFWREPIASGRLAIVSEFAPLAGWTSHQALQRNATAVRLSDVFVVVQAEAKSGTYSAGRSAIRLKRSLYVVSQSDVGAERFQGSEQLIAQGGTPLPVSTNNDINDDVIRDILGLKPSVAESPAQRRLL